jgi:PTH1 family peptidyl-tRNA hydrolase
VEKVVLMKPTTFMNRSGLAVGEAVRFFKLTPASDVIVLTDDTALPVGQIRVRASGGTGGHNGLADLDRALSGQDYTRVRVGVGAKPAVMDLADWVLSRFTEAEQAELGRAVLRAADAAECCVKAGAVAAMNTFNRRMTPPGEDTPPKKVPAPKPPPPNAKPPDSAQDQLPDRWPNGA